MSGGSDTKKPRNPLPWCLGSANFLGQVVKPPLISISRRVSSLLTQSLCFFLQDSHLSVVYRWHVSLSPYPFSSHPTWIRTPWPVKHPNYERFPTRDWVTPPTLGAGWTSFLGTSTRLSVYHLHPWASLAVCVWAGHTAIGIHVFPPSWVSLPCPTPSHPSRLSQSTRFELPVSYSKFPLAIYFIYGNAYVWGLPWCLRGKESICDAEDTGDSTG